MVRLIESLLAGACSDVSLKGLRLVKSRQDICRVQPITVLGTRRGQVDMLLRELGEAYRGRHQAQLVTRTTVTEIVASWMVETTERLQLPLT